VSNIKLFESNQIRSTWDEAEQKWYFSIIDVVAALTDSANPRDYLYRIKQREKISGVELSTICRQFKLEAPDGKLRETDCSHTEGLLRIIQSIPSPKAEPFKRWLAKVGYERLEEIENPELAAARMRGLYQAKGYSDEWIEKRVRGIAIRDELTNGHKNWLSLLKEHVMPVSLTSILSRERARRQTNRYATFIFSNGKNAA